MKNYTFPFLSFFLQNEQMESLSFHQMKKIIKFNGAYKLIGMVMLSFNVSFLKFFFQFELFIFYPFQDAHDEDAQHDEHQHQDHQCVSSIHFFAQFFFLNIFSLPFLKIGRRRRILTPSRSRSRSPNPPLRTPSHPARPPTPPVQPHQHPQPAQRVLPTIRVRNDLHESLLHDVVNGKCFFYLCFSKYENSNKFSCFFSFQPTAIVY